MRLIYNSDFLKIYIEEDILIQEWTACPLDAGQFKEELKVYLKIFKQQKPNGVVWFQENFDLDIPEKLYRWIEKKILEPQYKSGLRKLAFTIPNKKYAHLSIINSFNEIDSIFQPRYFSNRESALNFVRNPVEEDSKDLHYSLDREAESSKITLEVNHKQLPKTLKHIEKLNSHFKFKDTHKERFETLSIREFEIFKLICKGSSTKDVATSLFLSEGTIATHRKSIIKKLNIKSAKDWQHYADAFM